MKAKTSAQARTAAAQSKAAQRRVTKDFASLRNRLKRLTQRYSAPSANLHFDQLTHGDADVYPSILELAEQGFRSVRQHDEFFSRHSLYGDGMFWYGLFLFISAAARRVQTDRAQAYIPATTVDRLIDILVRMTPYSHVNGGDITKRNDEALGNTLLAFYDDKRIRTVRVLGRKNGISVDWILKRVNEVRSEARQLTADQPAGTEPYAEVWIPAEPEILVLYNPVDVVRAR